MYNYDTYLLLVKLCCFRVQSLEESSGCLINNSCSISTLSRAFLDCESLIHVDIISVFVCLLFMCGTHVPLSGIKKYLT